VIAAFFDLDKTVIAKASMVAFGPHLLKAGLISRRLMLRGLWTQMLFQRFGADDAKMEKFRQTALHITRGWDQARISAMVDETLIDVIDPIVFDEALALIRQHKADGHRVFIVSASPAEIVVPLATYLGVDEAIASRASVDAEGRYTGEIEFYSYGPYKAEAMEALAAAEGIDLTASYAYSDSITDLPMLEAVGHPTAVNPDRELARVAGERGWQVAWFDQPVPLRSRVPLPESRAVVLAAAGLAAAAAGTAVWWWQRRYPGRSALTTGVVTRRELRRPATS
jgi:HAD superfamily hydrolase (TIGR01490 family)